MGKCISKPVAAAAVDLPAEKKKPPAAAPAPEESIEGGKASDRSLQNLFDKAEEEEEDGSNGQLKRIPEEDSSAEEQEDSTKAEGLGTIVEEVPGAEDKQEMIDDGVPAEVEKRELQLEDDRQVLLVPAVVDKEAVLVEEEKKTDLPEAIIAAEEKSSTSAVGPDSLEVPICRSSSSSSSCSYSSSCSASCVDPGQKNIEAVEERPSTPEISEPSKSPEAVVKSEVDEEDDGRVLASQESEKFELINIGKQASEKFEIAGVPNPEIAIAVDEAEVIEEDAAAAEEEMEEASETSDHTEEEAKQPQSAGHEEASKGEEKAESVFELPLETPEVSTADVEEKAADEVVSASASAESVEDTKAGDVKVTAENEEVLVAEESVGQKGDVVTSEEAPPEAVEAEKQEIAKAAPEVTNTDPAQDNLVEEVKMSEAAGHDI